jgi:pimeloyl-ACP methyl ester carboxylesterase
MRRGYGGSDGTPPAASCKITEQAAIDAVDIDAAIQFLQSLSWAPTGPAAMIGVSGGALGTLASAGNNPATVNSVICIAGGLRLRGADFAGCYPSALLDSVENLGRKPIGKVLWIYSNDDPVFPPDLVGEMIARFKQAGGKVEPFILHVPSGDAHDLFSNPYVFQQWWARSFLFIEEKSSLRLHPAA